LQYPTNGKGRKMAQEVKYRTDFASIGEYADWYLSDEGRSANRKYCLDGSGGTDWSGKPKDTEEFLRTGWHNAEVEQLAARAASALKSHAELVTSPQITLTEHVAGAMVNIPAYLAGDPSFMFMPEMEMTPKVHPVATIVLSGCVSAGLSHDAIQRRGVYALALVRACQTLGHSVDLWHDHRCGKTVIRTHVMRPGDALSDAQLIAVTVHRAWSREFPFTAGNAAGATKRNDWGGTVYPADPKDYPEGAIITNTAPGTDDEMAEMVKDSLVEAGVLHFD
jgi:hypothetical protein